MMQQFSETDLDEDIIMEREGLDEEVKSTMKFG